MEQEKALLILLYLIGVIFVLAIFYHIIKAAVKNAMIEAHKHTAAKTERIPKNYKELQERYEKGELSLEQFQIEWNK